MICDCVSFFNELEILEIRLHELDSVVDRFVIVEAPYTHQGNPKPLYFKNNEERFKPWLHKIRYFSVDFPADLEAQCRAGLYSGDSQIHQLQKLDMNWARERYQRNEIMRGLTDCKADDTITICDLDEIPSANSIRLHERHHGVRTLNMLSFYYYLNLKVGEWNGPAKILPYDLLVASTPSNVRNMSVPSLPGSSGWHYSYMGGPKHIVQKIKSFAHAEYNTANTSEEGISHMLDTGLEVHGRPGFNYSNYTVYPEYVEKNKALFENLGFIRYPIIHSWTPNSPIPRPVPSESLPHNSGPYRPAC